MAGSLWPKTWDTTLIGRPGRASVRPPCAGDHVSGPEAARPPHDESGSPLHLRFVPPVRAHWQLALSRHELCQGGEFRSNLAQWSYLRDEGPLLGPEPDYHLPDSGLHDLPDPEFGVPDLLPGLVCRPSWDCPLWPSTPGQSHAPSPAA